MPVTLPFDVIDLILSYLCGTASIAECALVCQSWLPSARHHLLPPPKALRLDQFQIAEFLRLIDSPGSTLSFVTFKTLDLRQNTLRRWNDPIEGPGWRCEVAIRDFLARDLLSFRSVTSLSLRWVDWQTLSSAAVTSLYSNFTSVKELELDCIPFALSDFCMLLAALTALENVAICSGVFVDPVPSTISTVQMSHSLCHLVFHSSSEPCMFQFFARAIQYTSGITSVSITAYGDIKTLKACEELLETAGANLRALKLMFTFFHPLPDTYIIYHKLLAFPSNTNLQEIDVTPIKKSAIIPLLRGLKMKLNLSQLRLGLDSPNVLKRWTGAQLVDDALSAMVLKDPKLIVDLPILHHFWDYEDQPLEVLEALEKAFVEKSFERLKNMLPRTIQFWTLEVRMPSSSKLTYLRSTP